MLVRRGRSRLRAERSGARLRSASFVERGGKTRRLSFIETYSGTLLIACARDRRECDMVREILAHGLTNDRVALGRIVSARIEPRVDLVVVGVHRKSTRQIDSLDTALLQRILERCVDERQPAMMPVQR